MRIAAVAPRYLPAARVGARLATHEFLAALAARGHDVVVIVPDTIHTTIDGVLVTSLADVGTADVVVTHATDDRVDTGGRAMDVRMVHSHLTDPDALTGCDLAVFNSRHLEASTPHDCPSIVCPPPTWPEQVATTPGDRVTFVNLAEAKGGDLLWRLARNMPGHRFLGVIGAYGNQVIEQGHPNVDVTPTTDDMRTVWARTRLLLMPSERETWGMVGVEAMCSGIPVIAHPSPGLVESLGDAAIFIDRDDPERWLTEIIRLDDADAWKIASERALARVDELNPRWSVDLFTTALESLTEGGDDDDPAGDDE